MFPLNMKLDYMNNHVHWKCDPFVPTIEIERIYSAVKGTRFDENEMKRNEIHTNFTHIK
jgi:beta-galactosidase beta subunit